MHFQVIQNACATQAIINLLLNASPDSGFTLGPILEEFKNFTATFDPMVSIDCITAFFCVPYVQRFVCIVEKILFLRKGKESGEDREGDEWVYDVSGKFLGDRFFCLSDSFHLLCSWMEVLAQWYIDLLVSQ